MEFNLHDMVKFSPQYINKIWPTKKSKAGKKHLIESRWKIIKIIRRANKDYTDWEYLITIEGLDKRGKTVHFVCNPEDIIPT